MFAEGCASQPLCGAEPRGGRAFPAPASRGPPGEAVGNARLLRGQGPGRAAPEALSLGRGSWGPLTGLGRPFGKVRNLFYL